MIRSSKCLTAALASLLCVCGLVLPAEKLPERLDDKDFWQLTVDFSEPNGYFRSDNLLSNELGMQVVIPELVQRTGPGGAYLGVGPEQNFTYIAALKPKIVFITDIRRGNTYTHLMYKALFELSSDRADFVARLFTRKRPDGLSSSSTAQDIFRAFSTVASGDDAAFKQNLKAVTAVLTDKHKFPLSNEDLSGVEYVYKSFYTFGPDISYNSSNSTFQNLRGWGRRFTTYADLMVQTDGNGVNRGFLANEENFQTVKQLEEKNLLVPLVGDFAGPKALRAVGKYLKDHGAKVTAFYLSNVEQYLGAGYDGFCTNVANLPLDEKSTFIRSSQGAGGRGRGFGLANSLGSMQSEIKRCAEVSK